MLDLTGRCGVSLAFLALTAACDGNRVATPTAPTPITVPALPAFPAVTRPARVYVRNDSLSMISRYVLYDDHTFMLQSSSVRWGIVGQPGIYDEADGVVTFDWDGSSPVAPNATGLLTEESLTVQYSEMMHHADYVDGVYLRSR